MLLLPLLVLNLELPDTGTCPRWICVFHQDADLALCNMNWYLCSTVPPAGPWHGFRVVLPGGPAGQQPAGRGPPRGSRRAPACGRCAAGGVRGPAAGAAAPPPARAAGVRCANAEGDTRGDHAGELLVVWGGGAVGRRERSSLVGWVLVCCLGYACLGSPASHARFCHANSTAPVRLSRTPVQGAGLVSHGVCHFHATLMPRTSPSKGNLPGRCRVGLLTGMCLPSYMCIYVPRLSSTAQPLTRLTA